MEYIKGATSATTMGPCNNLATTAKKATTPPTAELIDLQILQVFQQWSQLQKPLLQL